MSTPSRNTRWHAPRHLSLATAAGLCTALWLAAACAPRPADPERPVKTAAPVPAPVPTPEPAPAPAPAQDSPAATPTPDPEPEPPAKVENDGVHMREGRAVTKSTGDALHGMRVIRSHSAEVAQCYRKALGQHPGLSGTIRARFRLSASGRVTDCRLLEDLSDPSVGRCICELSRGWRFESAEDGEEARYTGYTWRFEP